MTRSKTHARKRKFRDATETEERLAEQLVVVVWHRNVQEKLLCRDETLTLDVAIAEMGDNLKFIFRWQ